MSHPLVANIKRNELYDVYIGRGSKWGNPYVLNVDGDRRTVIEKYREYFITSELISSLRELRGKVLGCYCAPLPCHGDFLAIMANSNDTRDLPMPTPTLDRIIVAAKRDYPNTQYGTTTDGYTKRSGAPTSIMIRLENETRWRRLMVWQFSNAGTLFVRIKGEPYIVNEWQLPVISK